METQMDRFAFFESQMGSKWMTNGFQVISKWLRGHWSLFSNEMQMGSKWVSNGFHLEPE